MEKRNFVLWKCQMFAFAIVWLVSTMLFATQSSAASSHELTEEAYHEIVEETINLAEFFRADEDFIFEANSCLTKEQAASLKTSLIPQIFSEANAVTEEEQVLAIVSYVRSHMTAYDGESTTLCSNTYEMLCTYPKENAGAYFVGDCYNYTLAVRDLCALSGIPAILLGDENAYIFHDYQIVMVYIDGVWKFIDAFDTTSAILSSDELYSALHTYFQPAKMNFGYTKGNSVMGYAGSIYINETMLKTETGNAEFDLVYDKEKAGVIKVKANTPLANAYYYGSQQKTDMEGKVPAGMLNCTVIEYGENGEWLWSQAYSQHGVLLQGWVEIDGEEHDFSNFGSYGTLFYYEVVEQREPTEAEQAAVNQDVLDRVELSAQIGEALANDETYARFLDYTDEELAYIKQVGEEATSSTWVMKNETDENILATPKEEYTDYMKARGMVHWLNYNISYVGGFVCQDVYTTLSEKRGTCANYADALTELCVFYDIPCYTITGKLGATRAVGGQISDHAYNVLKLDGAWYVTDPTNGLWISPISTITNVKPAGFEFGRYFQKSVYISYEMMLRDIFDPLAALCYDFDDEGNLGIYYMNRTGPIANYKCKEFATDENGKLLQNNGFVTWEEKVMTDTGYEIWLYEGYSCQGYTIGGSQVIDGVEYPFPRERDMPVNAPIGYAKEKIEAHHAINLMEREAIAESFIYTGDHICPEITIKNGDTVLEENKDYTLKYYNNKDISTEAAGKAYCIVSGIGNYFDSYPIYYEILPKEITAADVTYSQEKFQWSIEVDEEGGFRWPEVSVNAPKEDYTVSCSGFGKTGKGTVVVRGRYNCTGRVDKVFNMEPLSITSGDFKVEVDSTKTYPYKKEEWEPAVTVTWYREDGSVYRVLSSAEYDVTYENNKDVGTAKVIVEGDDYFCGKLETSFEIVKTDLSNDMWLKKALADTANVLYTGEAIIPQIPGVNYFTDYTTNTGYVMDEDYTITITDNVNAGNATITLQGIGNYTGSMMGTFTILPIEIKKEELYITKSDVTYTGEIQQPEVIAGNLVCGKDYAVSIYRRECDDTGENYTLIPEDPIKEGLYNIKVELLNTNYQFWYSEMEKWLLYYIGPAPYMPPSGNMGGSGSTGGSGNAGGSESTGGSATTESPDSTGSSENTGNSGETGGLESTEDSGGTGGLGSTEATGGTNSSENTGGSDSPVSVKVSKVKKLKVKKEKNTLKISWKKVKNIKGYQLQYSTNKKFKKAKNINLKSKKTSYKLKRIKKKTTYYIRIRAYQNYKDANGKTKKAYGKWTVVKKNIP